MIDLTSTFRLLHAEKAISLLLRARDHIEYGSLHQATRLDVPSWWGMPDPLTDRACDLQGRLRDCLQGGTTYSVLHAMLHLHHRQNDSVIVPLYSCSMHEQRSRAVDY